MSDLYRYCSEHGPDYLDKDGGCQICLKNKNEHKERDQLAAQIEQLTAQLEQLTKERDDALTRAQNAQARAQSAMAAHDDIGKQVLWQAFEIEKLKAELATRNKVTRWIPVGERLPDPLENVLCVVKGKRIDISCHYQGGSWHYHGPNITHWRPLPEVPEDGE